MQAIFSDDSDDEGDNAGINNVVDPEKKIEGVNTTLNRLVAGDFLESLGKELGLEVPPDRPSPVNKISSFTTLTETTSRVDIRTSGNDKSASTLKTASKNLEDEKISDSLKIIGTNSASGKEAAADRNFPTRKGQTVTPMRGEADGNFSDHKHSEAQAEKREHRSRKRESHSRHHRHSSSSDTESSSDHGYYDRSKSRSEKRASSKRKSRKQSDHHCRKRSRSPTRYSSHDKDRDLSEDGRKDRRSRDREKHARKKHH